MSSIPKQDLKKFLATIGEGNFAFELINVLAKAFIRAEDQNTQDCVAYSIQELIQIYGVTLDGPPNSEGVKLWRRFSDEVQDIMMPLTQSR